MMQLALAKLDDQYLLYGAAGVVILITFVCLILVPAVSSYGRIWEKAAAGVVSIFVLAALIALGALVGLLVVYYYNDISDLFQRK